MFRSVAHRILAGMILALCALAVQAAGASSPSEAGLRPPAEGAPAQWDGLVLKPSARADAVYVRPDADIKAYKTVMLDPVEVSFAREWDPNRGAARGARRVGAKDIQNIRDRVASLFQEVFREELAGGGYTLVDQPDEDTLRVTPAIVDLYIDAPVTTRTLNVKTYSTGTGRMTLVLELRDAVTGAIIARAIDAQAGRDQHTITVSNELTNPAEARRIFGTWARALRTGLDELRTGD